MGIAEEEIKEAVRKIKEKRKIPNEMMKYVLKGVVEEWEKENREEDLKILKKIFETKETNEQKVRDNERKNETGITYFSSNDNNDDNASDQGECGYTKI